MPCECTSTLESSSSGQLFPLSHRCGEQGAQHLVGHAFPLPQLDVVRLGNDGLSSGILVVSNVIGDPPISLDSSRFDLHQQNQTGKDTVQDSVGDGHGRAGTRTGTKGVVVRWFIGSGWEERGLWQGCVVHWVGRR